MDKNPNDTFNVCSGSLLSVNDIVECVSETFNLDVKPIYRDATKLWDAYPELFCGEYSLNKSIVAKETNKYSKGSYQKAKQLLEWEPNTDLKFLIKKVASEIKL